MLVLILSVGGAILISAMCSLFEAVLYAVPVGQIESMSQSGKASGRILKRLREHVDRPISAILSLNTIANTAGAAVAGAAAANVFGEARLGYFSAAFTLAILLLSEVVPKTAGVVYSRTLAGLIARPLQVLVWGLAPLVWLCRGVTRVISRGRHDPGVSEEELIVMARLGTQTGTIDADELKVIENILALEKKRAADVMTPRSVAVTLDRSLTVGEARGRPGVLTHSRIPVYDATPDEVVGIVHRREILAAVADGRSDLTLSALASPVHFVIDSTPLDRLLRRFLRLRQHMFVVVDEHGGVDGIVTLEDVLEEILGQEIVDEFDEVADLRDVARKRREQILGGG